jgi:hypothetical protein
VRQGRHNPSVPAALFAGSEFHRRVLRRAGKPSPKETGKSETIRAATHAFSVVGQLGRAGHRIHKPKNNLDNLHQPELSQPTMVKQLRSRRSLSRIPLQGTSQEVEELRVRGPFLDPVFQPDSVNGSVKPFSFKSISTFLRYRTWAVLTILVEEGFRPPAALKKAFRGNANVSDHGLHRSAFVSVAEKVLVKQKFPDLNPVND